MSSSELFLTLLVAVVVFGPDKLPMLARHLGKLFRYLNQLKEQVIIIGQTPLQDQQLRENRRKAEKADLTYQNKDKIKERS
ncbi:Sec-independent protein translocase subunit TatA/TatB [Legionella fairfieldensis]|uniref:Sec-independent protein translocase subunit TatA/TatB n=1 Tax=Legionella fairfieldensis TaxID=45064 RepID=UPI000491FE28|nr:twin-arginine translocase TatA/TatE family subunit [Legionella fairfieldensis]